LKDLLYFVAVSHEEGLAREHFDEDAADGPNVHCCRVLFLPQQYLGRPVPEGLYLMSESFLGDHDESRESKIRNFDIFCVRA
jgi:hypothetical protein